MLCSIESQVYLAVLTHILWRQAAATVLGLVPLRHRPIFAAPSLVVCQCLHCKRSHRPALVCMTHCPSMPPGVVGTILAGREHCVVPSCASLWPSGGVVCVNCMRLLLSLRQLACGHTQQHSSGAAGMTAPQPLAAASGCCCLRVCMQHSTVCRLCNGCSVFCISQTLSIGRRLH